MAELIKDSVLPMPLQNQRFLVLESLLQRLVGLNQHAIIMLIDVVDHSSLMWFADHFSLFGDGWQFAVTEQEQRELIKNAIEIHRYKGTPWAIKRTLKLLGYGDCKLIERFGYYEHNSTIQHDGTRHYGKDGHWTHYQLVMQHLISIEEAQRIKALLDDVAPLRCKLVSIRLAQIRHNSAIQHSGSYTYNGVIKRWQ